MFTRVFIIKNTIVTVILGAQGENLCFPDAPGQTLLTCPAVVGTRRWVPQLSKDYGTPTSSPHFRQSPWRPLSWWYWLMNCWMPCWRTWSAYCLVSGQESGVPSVSSPISFSRSLNTHTLPLWASPHHCCHSDVCVSSAPHCHLRCQGSLKGKLFSHK